MVGHVAYTEFRTYQIIAVDAMTSLLTIFSKSKAIAIHFQAFALFTIAVDGLIVLLFASCLRPD
jgi:hypothetical protein